MDKKRIEQERMRRLDAYVENMESIVPLDKRRRFCAIYAGVVIADFATEDELLTFHKKCCLDCTLYIPCL